MKYTKTWISIDDQVKLLTKDKGLCCSNVDELKRALEVIGYYGLSAYWFPYKTASNWRFVNFQYSQKYSKYAILLTWQK